MTEGTSQGLFIVVAIVIFGIFVGLSYTLFEETLNPKMEKLFNTAIETVGFRTDNGNNEDVENPYPVETDESLFTFDKDTGTILKYLGEDTDIVIPKEIIGVKVTKIGNSAFYGKNLTKVTIPNSVIEIGQFAFESNNLTKVTIPDSVKKLGQYAFSRNKLTKVTIPDSVKEIGFRSFYDNNLTEVSIPTHLSGVVTYAGITDTATIIIR